jgi:hypothetical protein
MTKDGTDVVEQLRESSGTSSEANTPLETKQSLVLGDRVRMSALGRARHPRYGDLQGVIVGQGSPSSWRIKFDERKCVQALHQAYLEKAGRSGAGLSGRSDIKEIF